MDRTQLHSLLPHQGQALWLDALLGHDAERIEGLSAWHHLQALGHDASPCLLFEAAAQLCAAHGALYGEDNAIDMALVASCRSYNCTMNHRAARARCTSAPPRRR